MQPSQPISDRTSANHGRKQPSGTLPCCSQLTYTWRELEPERDIHDFGAVREHLALLRRHGKRLFVQLSDVSFTERVVVPQYLQTDPAFHGGATRKLEGAGGAFDGWVGRRWDPAVQARFARLLDALGREFVGQIGLIAVPGRRGVAVTVVVAGDVADRVLGGSSCDRLRGQRAHHEQAGEQNPPPPRG